MTIERLLEAGRAFDAGELDRAGEIYRQVADADPRSSIARVGLARVALRRGDEAAAVRLAEWALMIDPQNAAARGLVDSRRPEVGGDAAGDPERRGEPANQASQATASAPDQDWPWPDLEEQLEQYRPKKRSLLGRLLRRKGERT